MFSMFAAGGVVMFPILLVGLLALGAAGCHALAPAQPWRQTASTLRAALLALSAAGMCMDLSVGSAHMTEITTLEAMAQHASMVFSESLSPVLLGTMLASLGALLASVGDARQP